MNHMRARNIFVEIRERPFVIPPSPSEVTQNCYHKTVELIQRLAILGYTVRTKTVEIHWDTGDIPTELAHQASAHMMQTHIYAEVWVDNAWLVLDPTLPSILKKHNFSICEWGNNTVCLPIIQEFTQEVAINYAVKCSEDEFQQEYYKKCGKAWMRLNKHFAQRQVHNVHR